MKLKTLITLFILSSIPLLAQNTIEKKNKIKTLKDNYIAEELHLTAEESEKFWPIYNQYSDKQFELQHVKMKQLMAKLQDDATKKMNEKEASSLLSQLEHIEDDLYQNKKKLNADLKSILNDSQIIKLKKTEDDFNRKLLKQYHNKKSK